MKLTFRQQITQFAHVLQNRLFPALEEELGELSGSAKRLAAVLEMIPLARYSPSENSTQNPHRAKHTRFFDRVLQVGHKFFQKVF